MKTALKMEEAAMTLAAIYFLTIYSLDLPLWAWALLFFAPDISMLGYAVNARIGALSYNIFHHKGLAVLLAVAGYFFEIEIVLSTGILLFAHASFDRIWGYGLKYKTGFGDTHLGKIGKEMGTPIFQ